MAKYAKHGGILLTAAGVGMGCYNIAQAHRQQEKNEIFVETVVGAGVGTGASIALGVFLASTPIGWITTLALGTGTALFGILWMPLTWRLLSIFKPKPLLDKYYKPPHFTPTETILMAQFPGFLMRTSIFGWILLCPKLDRKRKLKGCETLMPLWYRVGLRILVICAVGTLIIV
jgi:hypothetical protein